MTVNAVGQNTNSSLNTVVKYTAVGTAAGYSLKYLWPVIDEENNISKRKFLNLSRKIVNGEKIAEFSALPQRTPAKDCFISMAESKDKETFSHSNIEKKIKLLGGKDSAAGKELKTIIKDADIVAKQVARRVIGAYNIALRMKRPLAPFIVTGAGAGFLAGFMHNFIKNDV